jgi:HTH-type transcriptional regulator/antitoxin HigA
LATRTSGAKSDNYLDLVRRFPLRPIRSDKELDAAICVMDSLIDQDDLSDGAKDYLDVLGDLVADYEDEHYPIMPASDADMLRHLLEAKGVTQADVARETGIAESTISEVLAGRRKLNRSHIGKLAHYFNVGPGVFVFEP